SWPAAPALAVGERIAPAETGESAEVAIAGDPLAPRLDGQGGQIGVGHHVALGRGAGAQAAEDAPVAWPRRHDHRIRLRAKRLREAKRLLDGCGGIEDTGMGR